MSRSVKLWHLIVASVVVLILSAGMAFGDPPAKDGQMGPRGPQGVQGEQGPMGPQGPKGERGKTGKAGEAAEAAVAAVAVNEGSSGGSTISDGTWEVGSDIQPGTYRAQGGSSCYFQTSSDANGDDIMNNSFGEVNVVVTLSSGQWFNTSDCGDWT
jgi:hypothetical protein